MLNIVSLSQLRILLKMQSECLEKITLKDVYNARERIKDRIMRTPLVPLNLEDPERQIYLKLENLQPIGSFKLRGALNAISCLPKDLISNGVYTASAGNFAQGLAWNAKELNIPCCVIMPDHAPDAKVQPTCDMGSEVIKVPFSDWWKVVTERKYEGVDGVFIHPVSEVSVISGNGTIGLEILEDLPDVDAIIVPYGGGGLSSGIALAAKALKPSVKVFACEVDTAAPLSASFKAGKPEKCEYTASFVDGMGSAQLLDEMWPLVKRLLDGSLVVTLQEVAEAIRLLAQKNHIIAEGAGAAPVAAAMKGLAGNGNVVCVISGGNIDLNKFMTILNGHIPT